MTAIAVCSKKHDPEEGRAGWRESAYGRDPDLWLYRERTLGMLRRYQRLSVEVGRLPSLLGTGVFPDPGDFVSRRDF